jgi:hypothetical protein
MAITAPTRAVDVDTMIAGAMNALEANGTISTALDLAHHPKRIANEVVAAGVTAPYIVLALASTIFESPYSEAVVNTLMDVSAYTVGESTMQVRSLIEACITALIDTAWTAAGFALWSVTMEEAGTGIRNTTSVTNGVITRGRQITLRVRAKKV